MTLIQGLSVVPFLKRCATVGFFREIYCRGLWSNFLELGLAGDRSEIVVGETFGYAVNR
jgi:hypothetical protein